MTGKKLQIEFPKDPLDIINEKLDRFFYLLFSVGLVFVVTLVVMTITLLIDSFHINSATYKEYSQKTEINEMAQEINQKLLDENKKNQELILKQQKQIIELLNN